MASAIEGSGDHKDNGLAHHTEELEIDPDFFASQWSAGGAKRTKDARDRFKADHLILAEA
ncbi:hypothetical protein CKO25_02940 [Thiocapsa imhoffii]|uniref:Uncharacterized protein n=1 Tax=Thiocapsa imhoffii TaxID=382777 RepID=A0A9X0WFP0_9GAMM|nr:hypothetical protein [Thiocapsa imhoffii]MBK1643630.1 hypothetical protein [Thiocapsa imhoffii]